MLMLATYSDLMWQANNICPPTSPVASAPRSEATSYVTSAPGHRPALPPLFLAPNQQRRRNLTLHQPARCLQPFVLVRRHRLDMLGNKINHVRGVVAADISRGNKGSAWCFLYPVG